MEDNDYTQVENITQIGWICDTCGAFNKRIYTTLSMTYFKTQRIYRGVIMSERDLKKQIPKSILFDCGHRGVISHSADYYLVTKADDKLYCDYISHLKTKNCKKHNKIISKVLRTIKKELNNKELRWCFNK
jgi:hypothetical protein